MKDAWWHMFPSDTEMKLFRMDDTKKEHTRIICPFKFL